MLPKPQLVLMEISEVSVFFFFSFIFISWRLIYNIAVGFVIH